MQNTKFIIQNENPSTDESPRHVVALSPLGKGRNGPPPFRQGRLDRGASAEVQEIVSAQVLFSNRKTADEVVGELWEKVDALKKKIDALQAEVDALKKKIEGTEE